MSLTIDTHDVDWALIADQPTDAATPAESSPVERWLFRMWGIRPGKSSPIGTHRTSYPYPPAVAEWLYAMWGIQVEQPLTVDRR
jgi:hypothetical protein